MEFTIGMAILAAAVACMAAASVSAASRMAGDRVPDILLGSFALFFAQVVAGGAVPGFAGAIGRWSFLACAVVMSACLIAYGAGGEKSGGIFDRLLKSIPLRPLPVGFFLPSRRWRRSISSRGM